MKPLMLLLLSFSVFACNRKTPAAFMDIELGKPLDPNKIKANPNFTIEDGTYIYKFANGTEGITNIFIKNNLVTAIGISVSNGKDDTGEEVCIDSTKKNYVRDLFIKKYGKPDKQTDLSLGNGIMESYEWYKGDMNVVFEVHRTEKKGSITQTFDSYNCLIIKISYHVNEKFIEEEKKKAKNKDLKNI